MICIYNITNCDTVKKARRWLDERDIEYRFHDLRRGGIDPDRLDYWLQQVDWRVLLNRKGTSWPRLDIHRRANVNADNVAQLFLDHPILLKRPMLETNQVLEVGFNENRYGEIFIATDTSSSNRNQFLGNPL